MKIRKWTYHIAIVGLCLGLGIGKESSVLANQKVSQSSSEPTRIKVSQYTQKNVTIPLHTDWKFKLGQVSYAEQANFDDSSWETIQIPHDYSITQDYTSRGEAESGYKPGGIGWYRKTFTLGENLDQERLILNIDGAYMNAEVYVNGQKLGMHPYGYTGFSFDITPYVRFGKQNVLAIKTDNPIPSSRWYSGSGLYRSVNLIVKPNVHVKTHGIVIRTPDLNRTFGQEGNSKVEVSTTVVNTTETDAQIVVKQTLFERDSNGMLGAQVASAQDVLQEVSAKQDITVNSNFVVTQPKLWSPEHPNLYVLRTELFKQGEKIQEVNQEMGFRYIQFDANTGFSLNGSPVKLKGVSMHHDQGALGSAAYYDAIERQFLILKQMGVNAVRVTHNPSARAMKDVANRVGMLLIEEAFDTWHYAKNGNTNDYAKWFTRSLGEDGKLLEHALSEQTWAEYDTKQMVRHGINDPSIIMWSTGNEVMEGFSGNVSAYPQVIAQIGTWIDALDGTRPVTLGDNKLKDNWTEAIGMAESLTNKSGLQGVVGYNYAGGRAYDAAHQQHPNWIIYGSETASAINSRGVYNVKGNAQRSDKQLTSYDQSTVGWGHVASQAWYDTVTRDFVAGEFVWTGFDYLGEPTPWNGVGSGAVGSWPSPKSSYFGIVDTSGVPKDSYYFYQSQWNTKQTTLHVLPAWHHEVVAKDNDNQVEVVVYSNAHKVKLVYIAPDGTQSDLGEKTFTKYTTPTGFAYQLYQGADKQREEHKNLYLTWKVPYRDGTIKAIAYDENNQEITDTKGTNQVSTFAQASKLVTKVNKDVIQADEQSLAYVEIDVQDAEGNLVANADTAITVQVTGPAKLIGLDNGNAVDHQSYQENNRKAFNGKLVAIVKMTGESGQVSLTASASHLASSTSTIQVTEKESSEQSNPIESYVLSKIIYLKRGNDVQLPHTIRVRYADGQEEDKAVSWNMSSDVTQKLSNGESSMIEGTIEGTGVPVSVYVNVIDEVVAMENYSTATERGVRPVLPETASAYTAQGTLINAQFPVTWENTPNEMFNDTGVVIIRGQADVLGEKLPIQATIRVAEKTITIAQNVAPVVVRLTEDTPEHLRSDNLLAINNRSITVSSNDGGGDNPSVWSNYKAAQAGIKTSTLNFEYDTAQNITQVTLYHNRDSWSARAPKSVQFTWKASPTSQEESISAQIVGSPTEIGSVTKTVYRLAKPVPAVVFSIHVENSDEDLGNRQACIVFSEVELHTALEEFPLKSSATLANWSVNGKEATQYQLNNRQIKISDLVADIVANNESENVAVTVLPARDNVINIFTKSEDKTKTLTYQVLLNTLESDDDSLDIPAEQTTINVGSVQPGESDKAGNAIDKNPNTIWHTKWSGDTLENLWLSLDLGTTQAIEALRYLPRQTGGDNGKVLEYRVVVSQDGQTWEEVAHGNWDNNAEWKIAQFDKAVHARYVRLQGVQTVGDGGRENTFMSAAEVRVRRARALPEQPTEQIVDTHVTFEKDVVIYTGQAIENEPVVTINGKTLTKDTDYTVTYEHNTDVGKAKVIVEGKGNYTGRVEKEFTISAQTLIPEHVKVSEMLKEYTGQAIENEPVVTINGKTLTKDTDYTITYEHNTDVGKAKVIVEGKGNYTGRVEKEFTISTQTLAPEHVKISEMLKEYTGQAIENEQTVTINGKTLIKDTDYTVTYEHNTDVGKAKVIVEGKGNYTGRVEKEFTISAQTLTPEHVKISEMLKEYTGQAIENEPVVTINGKTLIKDTDYTITYEHNTDVGKAKVIVEGKGNYTGRVEKEFTISTQTLAPEHVKISEMLKEYTGQAIENEPVVAINGKTLTKDTDYTITYEHNTDVGKAKVIVEGRGNYTGRVEKEFTISAQTLTPEHVKISEMLKEYTGQAIENEPVVTINGKTLTKDTDYTITYEHNTDVGKAKVIVEGKGNYTGRVEKEFTIVTRPVNIDKKPLLDIFNALSKLEAENYWSGFETLREQLIETEMLLQKSDVAQDELNQQLDRLIKVEKELEEAEILIDAKTYITVKLKKGERQIGTRLKVDEIKYVPSLKEKSHVTYHIYLVDEKAHSVLYDKPVIITVPFNAFKKEELKSVEFIKDEKSMSSLKFAFLHEKEQDLGVVVRAEQLGQYAFILSRPIQPKEETQSSNTSTSNIVEETSDETTSLVQTTDTVLSTNRHAQTEQSSLTKKRTLPYTGESFRQYFEYGLLACLCAGYIVRYSRRKYN
ncbi:MULTISPECIES: glycoside hydrolase family 2 TIM barrel-domain containing protein [unclassified Granulicatella]|uniref:glycoside hydrolase family 2 TIM barrel-domain containing protein n=1 Tax=unclassified Granulicatella TaxID=2630493 RepID=UPI001074681B|nr:MULTISPECIES: glycoside hydrolase family 2 TIM barrel-domain containing protein [unclassified Granulicatella]MBF0779550.1 discoidin domain-containing protein [Granulicatella sp. 19428wC4_WM01]TFU96514.1 DUF4982 domain-containing protein [Granulicatella sp. WM01]